VADALEILLERQEADIGAALLLPNATRSAAIEANRAIRSASMMPALDRYAGVVYDGLDAQGLSTAARRCARRSVLIFSGLFGVLRASEPVPVYRVPAKAVLPGIGVVGTFWRPILDVVVPDLLDRGPIIDLRSADYAAMWRHSDGAESVITVRILSPNPRGGYAVISYPSKHGKGRLAAGLLERQAHGEPVRVAEDIVETWVRIGGRDGDVAVNRGRSTVELRTYTASVVGRGR
jgi:uncharacterized protein